MRAAFSAVGVQFFLSGGNKKYSAVMSDIGATEQLIPGGFFDDYSFTLHCLKEDFSALPVIGDKITVESKSYRIFDTSTSSEDPEIRLHCQSDKK